MAAKKINEAAMRHGLIKMLSYAKKHGFRAFSETYRIVRKHGKQKMKEIDAYGRQRISSEQEEFCEIIKVTVFRKGRCPVKGYLVGYASKGIRFDANAKY